MIHAGQTNGTVTYQVQYNYVSYITCILPVGSLKNSSDEIRYHTNTVLEQPKQIRLLGLPRLNTEPISIPQNSLSQVVTHNQLHSQSYINDVNQKKNNAKTGK